MTVAPLASLDLICLAPLRLEAAAMVSGLGSSPAGRTAQVMRTGAGRERAASAAQGILDSLNPDRGRPATRGRPHPATVVTGVAGALRSGLPAGHLVVANALIGIDGVRLDVDLSAGAGLACALRAAGLTVLIAPIATSATLVRGTRARAALAASTSTASTGPVALDLESSILAAVAWPGPFAVVRSVVDRPEAELLSPATVTAGIAALRSLRRAAPVIAAWARTLHPLSTAAGRH